ncbi:uncharacterized protein LOC133697022 [Populus nigra]|uniref:uncharacterized protein LOC133697022 n=1 Tax=Populus nigra TaxID=3691 RepID=UPI002B2769A0|nr:uncharacterized protein LOC133697022 [Populus nigra]
MDLNDLNKVWEIKPLKKVEEEDAKKVLEKECEELMAKGITGTGQGFGLPGRGLGGFSRQPRPSALAAAENRARRDTLLPSGPKRVGGDNNIKAALSPIEAAAPWLLKGDYTMTCGVVPSLQIVSLLSKEMLDVLKAQVLP